tara:strand:- start:347 stop:1069 length:723 start_codon:yes stop_codon:yes gene_type:complete
VIKGNKELRRYTTIYPKTVTTINSWNDYKNYGHKLLKQSNNSKLGKIIGKGAFVKKPLYSLSLVEREMGCPKSCHHWDSCYGNNMPFAHRFKTDKRKKVFKDILLTEIQDLLKKHKFGIHIRLHVLGDFYSSDYAWFWGHIVGRYPKLSVYGYTAHSPKSKIGHTIKVAINMLGFDRFAIRFSNADVELSANSTEYKPRLLENVSLNPIVCPEQLDKVANCVSCGLCWNSNAKQILFKTH